jgi:hypothetical protein
MFEHASEYRRVNRALFGSNAEAIVRRQIHSVLAGIVGNEVEMEFRRRKRVSSAVSPELLTHFLVSTYISVMSWWLKGKNPVPPRESTQRIGISFCPALRRFSRSHNHKLA